MTKRITQTQCVLTVVYVAALMVANIVEAKQTTMFGVIMTCGNITFPVTYVLSDVFSEVYGYKWSRKTCWMAFAMNAFMAIVFQLAISTPPADGWELQDAFAAVLSSTPRITAASLGAFFIGDAANDIVFSKMRLRQGEKGFCSRAWVSSLAGEIADSMVFIPLAFAGVISFDAMPGMVVAQVAVKMAAETVMLPVTQRIAKAVAKHEEVSTCHEEHTPTASRT